MIDSTTATHWVQRWDRQQEHYAEHREARFAAMIDRVEQATAAYESPVVVDIGAGPGSLAARVAEAMPKARVVAVESDPFLVALGGAWCGDSVAFATATAGSPGWRTRLGLTHVQAVLASSALHYPPLARLRTLYADILDWLTPGGILINADHFDDLAADRKLPRAKPDTGPWTTWWRDAEAACELTPMFALRPDTTALEADDAGENELTTSEHIELLGSVGFNHTELAWRRDRSGLIVARKVNQD